MPKYECAMCPPGKIFDNINLGRIHLHVEHRCADMAMAEVLLRTVIHAAPPQTPPQIAAPKRVTVKREVEESDMSTPMSHKRGRPSPNTKEGEETADEGEKEGKEFKCQSCSATFSRKLGFMQHRFFEHLDNSAHAEFFNAQYYASNCHRCTLCPHAFHTAFLLKSHTEGVHEGGEGAFPCHMCHKLVRTKHGLRLHEMKVHWMFAAKEEGEMANKEEEGEMVNKAEEGEKTNKEEKANKEDVVTSTSVPPMFNAAYYAEREHRCEHCPRAYMGINELRKHCRAKHSHQSASMPVPSVDQSPLPELAEFGDMAEDRAALGRALDVNYTSSAVGGNRRANPTEYDDAYYEQRNDRCDYCPKAFDTKYGLKRHLRSVHGVVANEEGEEVNVKERVVVRPTPTYDEEYYSTRPHRCTYCAKAYGNKASLSQHRSKEHPEDKTRDYYAERGILCPVDGCSKAFKTKSSLYMHNRCVHLGIRQGGKTAKEGRLSTTEGSHDGDISVDQ